MEARTKSVEHWFSMIHEGQVTLPRFQRFEAWRRNQIQGVLENILREPSLPIGALLVLEIGDEERFESRSMVGAPSIEGRRPSLYLLDGQQRMTALWRSLTGNYTEFCVLASLENSSQPVVIIERMSDDKSGGKKPRWLSIPSECLKRNLVPVDVLCPGTEGERRMNNWIEQSDASREDERVINKYRNRIGNYPIPYMELPSATEADVALDVFVNMNTSSTPLRDFDIVVAQLERAEGDSLHDKITRLESDLPAIKRFGKVGDTALAVGALLNGKPPLKKTYLEKDFAKDLTNVWPNVEKGLKRGIEHLSEESIFNAKLLPSEVILYMVSALWANVPNDPDVMGKARVEIRKAIWRASFTDRYAKTATTRTHSDYKAIYKNLNQNANSEKVELYDEDIYPLPTLDEIMRGAWPTSRDRLGRAITLVSLYHGGLDLADGSTVTADNVSDREYHHLFPKDMMKERANVAVNCAVISRATNRKLSNKPPKEYIEKRASEQNTPEEMVRQRLQTHLIPYDEILSNNFDDFIEARAKLVETSMKALCNGDDPKHMRGVLPEN